MKMFKLYNSKRIILIGISFGITCVFAIMLWGNDELGFDSFNKNTDNIYQVIVEEEGWSGHTNSAITMRPLVNALKDSTKTITSSKGDGWESKIVTATAYNSLEYQTNSKSTLTAFGDSLKPGMKCIAVSSDLLKAGLKRNTRVKIEGLEGEYIVNDKMYSRWTNKIDIYMGVDVDAAKQWGKKRVRIEYCIQKED